MRLIGFNKYWNRWDEIYDFPFIRKDYEAIRVRVTEGESIPLVGGEEFVIPSHFTYIQRGNYSEFRYIEYEIDSMKKILQDICFVMANLMWVFYRWFNLKIIVPFLGIQEKINKFAIGN